MHVLLIFSGGCDTLSVSHRLRKVKKNIMKRRNWKQILCFSLLILTVLTAVLAVPQAAKGFGDFDSHSDFGGSSSGSHSSGSRSSGSDSDGFDLAFLYHIAEWISDLLGIHSPVAVMILLVLILLALRFGPALLRGRSEKGSQHQGSARRHGLDSFRPETIDQLKEADPGFDESALLARVRDLFERMQTAWEAGNIDSLNKDFIPDTWARFQTQLQNKNAAGETSHVRDIVFDDVRLLSYGADSEKQSLHVKITVTHNIWTTDRAGKCIQGTEKTRKRFEFIWTLVRPAGAVTGGAAPADTAHCPNCGAEVDLEAFAECPFCHTPILKESPDWAISEIDALSQTTLRS